MSDGVSDETTDETTDYEVYEFDLIEQAARDLAKLLEETDLSMTDAVNRAISLYEFLQPYIDGKHNVLLRDRATGETITLIFRQGRSPGRRRPA